MEWEVSDLMNARAFMDRDPPTVDNLRRIHEEMYGNWIPQEDSADNPPPGPNEVVTWAADRFGVDLDTFTFSDLDNSYRRHQQQIVTFARLKDTYEELKDDNGLTDELVRVANCMKSAYESLYHCALLYHRMDPGRELRVPSDAKIESLLNLNIDKLTNFQKLIMHVTKMLNTAEYRKVNDECWVQIQSSEGFYTQAWQSAMPLKDFVYKKVQKEMDLEQWLNMTNPKDNADNVIRHLIASQESEFRSITVDRHKWSYDDGIYHTETDTFWPYDERSDWEEQAVKIQEYRRSNGWGDDYKVTPPSSEFMSVKYFDRPFRFRITPETEAAFDPRSIELVEMDKVLDAQHLDEKTKLCVLMMLARLFFKVGEKDRWQVILFIKGVAASGKSTLAKLIRAMYPSTMVSTLASNVEQKFGLSAIYKSLICICAEVRHDFGLDQADWQSAATGEEVSIAIKNKTAFSHLWDTPFFFLGNEVPNYKNASGSVDRRIFMVEFNHKVQGSDPQLFDKLIENIDLFHRKSVSLYLEAVRNFGHKDIWSQTPKLLPDQIYDFKNNMRRAVDCLYNFLHTERFEYHPTYRMVLKDFKEMYSTFRRENGEDKCKWGPQHYGECFQTLGISIEKEDAMVNGKNKKDVEILKGIREKVEESEE